MIRKLKLTNWHSYSSGKVIHSSKYKRPKKGVGFKRPLLIGFSIFIISMVMYKNKAKQLQFILQKTELNKKIIRQNKYFNIEQYAPTIYLSFAPWMQLIKAKYFENHKNIKLKQQKIGTSSVYYVAVHNQLDKDDRKTACVLVIGGSEKLNYTMEHLMHYISSNKFETVGVVVQDIHDQKQLETIVNQLKKSRKNQNFYAVGIEYGANLLIKASAQNPTLFQSIVSIGNPLDLQIAEQRVSKSWGAKLTYLPEMIKGRLQSKNIQKAASDLNLYNIDKILYKIESDQKLHELKQKNSSINYLSKLKVPTLLLNSKQDDFSIQFNSNQSQQLENSIQENPLVMSILTENGGHNQWFYNLMAYRWMPSAIISHLKIIDRIFTQNPQLLKAQ